MDYENFDDFIPENFMGYDDSYFMEHPIANYKGYDIYVDFGPTWKYFAVVNAKIVRFGQKQTENGIYDRTQYHDLIGYYSDWNTYDTTKLDSYYDNYLRRLDVSYATSNWFESQLLFPDDERITSPYLILLPNDKAPASPQGRKPEKERQERKPEKERQEMAYTNNGDLRPVNNTNSHPVKIMFVQQPPYYGDRYEPGAIYRGGDTYYIPDRK